VPDHEGQLLVGHEFGGSDEVALVFSVRVVDDHDHPALGQGRDRMLDGLGGRLTSWCQASSPVGLDGERSRDTTLVCEIRVLAHGFPFVAAVQQ
jgi:hypothetical protein